MTNVLNGTVAAGGNVVDQGTVVRITLRMHGHHPPVVTSNQVIADGFAEHTDPDALVVGPTGVGLGDRRGALRRRFERQPDRRRAQRAGAPARDRRRWPDASPRAAR